MTDLSPAALAIWEAFNEDEAGVFVDYGDKLASAIRAAADQVVPGEFRRHSVPKDVWLERCDIRRQLCAIAAELDGANNTSGKDISND
jgi:hypothetical protein